MENQRGSAVLGSGALRLSFRCASTAGHVAFFNAGSVKAHFGHVQLLDVGTAGLPSAV